MTSLGFERARDPQGFHRSDGNIGNSSFESNFEDKDYFLNDLGKVTNANSLQLTKQITVEE